ncbi:hypothetical protein BDB00DRAFT_879066 [Zychaea mexicana]|uniref:uncharacterized protein n=1 Tax=Zychaea mexicana TaxID=64656 RepID=UPI0022FE399A|nr:uncharacterized protein BDB00DRAFT_879066 [Zychaea mexicana]KAI9482609.1 hypothetical protein BDB00DRAFT_879066 [Zychaea mexicana]
MATSTSTDCELKAQQLAANTDLRADIKRIWIKRYQIVAKQLNVDNIVDKNIDWDDIKTQIQNKKKEQCSSKRSRPTTSTQTSKSSSWELTAEAKDRFKKDYEGMEEEKKWLLRTKEDGAKVYLEDIMFQYGMECDYEHTVHSFIIDPKDDCWQDLLTKQELAEIETVGGDVFPSLDDSVQEIFEQCEMALQPLEENDDTKEDEYVKCIWKAITSFGFFDPDVQAQQYWIQ